MHKVMFINDSDGYPRSFPASEAFELEETYPYLIREHLKDSTFWQTSIGGASTKQLVNQPLAYLTHWKPDIIIVQCGIGDCRPEGFTEFQLMLIQKSTWRFFKWLKKYVYHPKWIKFRQGYRVTKGSFKRTIKRFKLGFPDSKIFWLEISTGSKYEEFRPGVERRMNEYNDIIKEIYGEDFVPVRQRILDADGFNGVDHAHMNKRGHQVIADALIERIDAYLGVSKEVALHE